MSPLGPRMLLLLVFTLGTAPLASQPPPPEKPQAAPTSVQEALASLRKAGKAATAQRLSKAIDAAKAERQKRGQGHVVVGRLTIQGGPGKLEQLRGPLTFVEGGWFIAQVENMQRPLPLRLHGYAAVNVPLREPPPGEVLYVGELFLNPLPPEKLGTVRGRVVAADPKARLQAYALLTPGDSHVPGTGDTPAARVPVRLEKDGRFELSGLSPPPARYEFWFKAPGHATLSRLVNAPGGMTQDLGELRLEKATRLRVRYVLSSTPPPFSNPRVREAVVEPGQPFKADAKMKGATFSYLLRPAGERLRFQHHPARLAALAQGQLEDFTSVNADTLSFVSPFEVGFEAGKLYLLDHRAAGHWVLFELEPASSGAK